MLLKLIERLVDVSLVEVRFVIKERMEKFKV